MSTFGKSLLLWIGGGIAGMAIIPRVSPKHPKHEKLWAFVGGAALVGSVGDKWLESQPGYDDGMR